MYASCMLAILDKLFPMSPNLTLPHGTHKKIMFREIKGLAWGHIAGLHWLECTNEFVRCVSWCPLNTCVGPVPWCGRWEMWKRATLFWGVGHRNRLATWSQFMAPFCFLRVGSWWANHSLLVVWFTGFGNSVSGIQRFSSKATYISLGLVHEVLGLKSLRGRKHCFGSQSLVFMERLLYRVTCGKQSLLYSPQAHGLELITGHLTHCGHSLKTDSLLASLVTLF